jgi:hypothetical protein
MAQSIEKSLEKIAIALEKLSAVAIPAQGQVMQTQTSAPPTSPEDDIFGTGVGAGAGNEEKSYTIDDVREALKQFMDKTSPAEAKKLLTKFGAEKISDLDPSKYTALIKIAKK